MNKIILKILFCYFLLGSVSLNAQSIVKFISGKVTQTTVDNITSPIYGINIPVNNSSTLRISDYIIIEINNSIHKVSNEDYPDGFLISSFSVDNKEVQDVSLWDRIYNAVFNDEFGDEEEIEDGLYMSDFQGISRSSNLDKNEKNLFVCNEYQTKIDWSGTNISIASNDKIIFKQMQKESNQIILDINVLDSCTPCVVIIDGRKSGQITSKPLSEEYRLLADYLLKNINSNIEVEFSQYCLFNIFIQNQLFLNANYCRFTYKDNKMIKDYFSDIVSF